MCDDLNSSEKLIGEIPFTGYYTLDAISLFKMGILKRPSVISDDVIFWFLGCC